MCGRHVTEGATPSLGLVGTCPPLAQRHQGDLQVLMCLALAQPPPVRSPPARGGILGVLQLSQQHPQSCPSPDARRWLVPLTIRESAVAAAASQPIITWHHFPRSLVCICLASAFRPKPDAWLRIMQVGRSSHLVERNGGGFPPAWHSNWACLQRVSPPENLVWKEPLVAPQSGTSCSQPAPLHLALDGRNAQQRGGQELWEREGPLARGRVGQATGDSGEGGSQVTGLALHSFPWRREGGGKTSRASVLHYEDEPPATEGVPAGSGPDPHAPLHELPEFRTSAKDDGALSLSLPRLRLPSLAR